MRSIRRRLLLAGITLILVAAAGCLSVRIRPTPTPVQVDEPCSGGDVDPCRPAQSDLYGEDVSDCTGGDHPICLVPLGAVDVDLVHRLVDFYHDEYDVTLQVMHPLDLDENEFGSSRGQLDANALFEHIIDVEGGVLNQHAPNAAFIGLTPFDISDRSDPNNNYVFGLKGDPAPHPVGIISTYRMDPRAWGLTENDDVVFDRLEKMFSRYVAIMVYSLPQNNDPTSILYRNIGGLDDLDRIIERLPTPAPR
jgi:predicted Zn-dependent protease